MLRQTIKSKDKEKFTEDRQDISDLRDVSLNFPKMEILIHLLFSGYKMKHFRALLQNVVFRFTSKKKNSSFHREHYDYQSVNSQYSLAFCCLQAEHFHFLFNYFSYSQVEFISLGTECCLNMGIHHPISSSSKWLKISLRKKTAETQCKWLSLLLIRGCYITNNGALLSSFTNGIIREREHSSCLFLTENL